MTPNTIPGHILRENQNSKRHMYPSTGCVDHNKLWKILQEMGIPNHLTHLLRNLYAGQETTVRTGHGTRDWFQIRKEAYQGYILPSCLFNFYAAYIMRNIRPDEAQARFRKGRGTRGQIANIHWII